jgi:TetR/AcrR family transcriptional regulator, cholesterol catabolism regulator
MRTSTARRPRASSLEKRQRILDAAAKVLARQGYAETTLHHVAGECGTYAASLYYYFPSRDDLVKEVMLLAVDRFGSAMAEAVRDLPAGATAMDRLKAAVRAMLDLSIAKDDYAVAYNRIFDQLPAAMEADIETARAEVPIGIAELLAAAKDTGEIPAATDMKLARILIIGTTHWMSKWNSARDMRSAAAISEEMTEMLLRAIGRV